MNQYDFSQNLYIRNEDALEYSEIISDLDYGQEEIKPFQLDALFMEIEQLLLSPVRLAEVSLVA